MRGSPLGAVTSSLRAIQVPSAVAGVGLDLVEVEQFRELLDAGDAFLATCFTDAEVATAGRTPERLAARWAAKEAIMKAIQCGLGDLDPLHIEILNLESEAPVVTLTRTAALAAGRVGVEGFHVSLCHENGWASAIVIAHGPAECLAQIEATPSKGSDD